jgi:hypothetical protein
VWAALRGAGRRERGINLRCLRAARADERLLDDRQLWEQRSRAGLQYVAEHTWDRAADTVEAGLRHALRLCEQTAHRDEALV